MRANLEIKAHCADLSATRERARAVATEWIGLDRQVDTYFVTRSGRLKLRESSVSGGQLIPYRRPDLEGPRRSDYQVIAIDDPAGLKALLTELLGIHRIVAKDREIALFENVRIHLDRVDGLGDFVELEAVFDGSEAGERLQQEKVRFLIEALHIEADGLVAGSYEGMVAPGG